MKRPTKIQKDAMKELINWLEVNCYFHRFVSRDLSSVYENIVIVRLESYHRMDTELIKFNELFHNTDAVRYHIGYSCTVGGNYITIEIL